MRTLLPLLLGPLLLAGLFGQPAPGEGQSLGLAVTHLGDIRADLPGGPGISLSLGYEVRPWLRVDATVGRVWGGAWDEATTCDFYWPLFEGCIRERVRRTHRVMALEGAVRLVSPEVGGFRIAPGILAGAHHLDVAQRGVETGRERRPFGGRGDSWPAFGVLLGVERPVGEALRIEGGVRHLRVWVRDCVTDTWGICADLAHTRLELGFVRDL